MYRHLHVIWKVSLFQLNVTFSLAGKRRILFLVFFLMPTTGGSASKCAAQRAYLHDWDISPIFRIAALRPKSEPLRPGRGRPVCAPPAPELLPPVYRLP